MRHKERVRDRNTHTLIETSMRERVRQIETESVRKKDRITE